MSDSLMGKGLRSLIRNLRRASRERSSRDIRSRAGDTEKSRSEVTKRRGIKEQPLPSQVTASSDLTGDLKSDLNLFRTLLGHSRDAAFREIRLGSKGQLPAALVYLEDMVSKPVQIQAILRPLLLESRMIPLGNEIAGKDAVDIIQDAILPAGDIKRMDDVSLIVLSVLAGDTALLIHGSAQVLVVSTRGWNMRQVSEPGNELVIRGPREGFTENLRNNVALIRSRLKSPDLEVRYRRLGFITHTDAAVIFINGIADPEIIDEVMNRIDTIQIDGILEGSYLEEFIEDNPYSPFPQIEHTERPDKVVASLLEGRIAIMTDGTPFAMVVPTVFGQYLQSGDDYYQRYHVATFIRLLRLFSMFVSLILPGAYLAIITIHPEMIPTTLLISIASQREGVPFPAIVEALLMEGTFEILRESGLRMPARIGQAISVVGAIVLGQAAVSAGLVSPAMVMIVSLTGLASFAIPSFAIAIPLRLLRFGLMVTGSILGIFGIMAIFMVVVAHLASLRSFGVPYTGPIFPFRATDMKDFVVRVPWWAMTERPKSAQPIKLARRTEEVRKVPSESRSRRAVATSGKRGATKQ